MGLGYAGQLVTLSWILHLSGARPRAPASACAQPGLDLARGHVPGRRLAQRQGPPASALPRRLAPVLAAGLVAAVIGLDYASQLLALDGFFT